MGSANVQADLLSRQKIQAFKNLHHTSPISLEPEPLPAELWPASNI